MDRDVECLCCVLVLCTFSSLLQLSQLRNDWNTGTIGKLVLFCAMSNTEKNISYVLNAILFMFHIKYKVAHIALRFVISVYVMQRYLIAYTYIYIYIYTYII